MKVEIDTKMISELEYRVSLLGQIVAALYRREYDKEEVNLSQVELASSNPETVLIEHEPNGSIMISDKPREEQNEET